MNLNHSVLKHRSCWFKVPTELHNQTRVRCVCFLYKHTIFVRHTHTVCQFNCHVNPPLKGGHHEVRRWWYSTFIFSLKKSSLRNRFQSDACKRGHGRAARVPWLTHSPWPKTQQAHREAHPGDKGTLCGFLCSRKTFEYSSPTLNEQTLVVH